VHSQSEKANVSAAVLACVCVSKITYVGAQAVVGKLERQRGVNAEGVEIHTCARIRSWAPRA